MLFCQPLHLRKIYPLRLAVDVVRDEFIGLTGKINLVSVGEVAAVREVHGHDRIAGFEQGKIGCHVCLGTTVRLDVSVLGTEKGFRPLNS